MIKKLLLLFFISFAVFVHSQTIVINELDSDTPSTDVVEFVELKTVTPSMALDGYVVVFFNGSDDASYAAYDLDGFTSDINGVFVIGNSGVSPSPSINFASNFLQNGADAVAIYQDNATTFPNGTAVTLTNLVDAIVYDTADADDTGLLTGLGKTTQYDENANSNKDNQSIQRKSDGTYEVKTPTPGKLNDGSGITQVNITISTPLTLYNEGDAFTLTFTTSETVTADLVINYTLANDQFTSADYTGNLTVTIPNGSTTAATQISLIDDAINEDIETIIVKYVNLDTGYLAYNDNYTITVYDNDFTTSTWGTPENPTYGLVSSTAPVGYYDSLDGKSGQALKDAITAIIANPTTVRAQTYGDIWDILKEADENPENNNQVWLIYTEQGRYKSLQQGSDGGVGKWNREHIYAQSRGGFSDGTSTTADGKDVYMATDATHLEHGHSDAHHLRPADPGENSTRNNNDFGAIGDEYNGPIGNKGSWKGDVARALMFMSLRYNGLSIVAGNPADTTVGAIGDTDYLFTWNTQDPPDDYEMHRNNVIYDWQRNRNPFIDLPALFDYVYGSKTSLAWDKTLSIDDVTKHGLTYVNPVSHYLQFQGQIKGDITVYNSQGSTVFTGKLVDNRVDVSNLKPGIYFFKIKTESTILQGKIIKL